MASYSSATLLILLLISLGCLAVPLPGDKIDSSVSKRTLEDGSSSLAAAYNPYLTPYGIYPGIKPLRPILPPAFFLNRFATPPPPVDPMAQFFKSKKDEFLNKLFNDIAMATDAPSLEARSIVDPLAPEEEVEEEDPATTDIPTTTPKPKVDPSVFITKKFDFLAQLFKTLNTTTIAPPTVDPLDPTATTVKPTIVPPGFWAPFPKPPKPPKPTKPPKPEKTKGLLLDAIDEAILKAVLAGVDPTNPALDSGKATREVTFLDKFLHRVTEAPPTETTLEDSTLETRSLFPPGYWIPPYIYAAKMGIYLDKMFDTLDTVAMTDETGAAEKRSAGDPSNLILDELTALKNQMALAYAEGIKSAKTPAPLSAKPTPKTFKKPFWGPKTTPAPDVAQQKLDILSDVYDKLTAVEQQLLNGTVPSASPDSDSASTASATPTTSYWAPDPTAADISEFYKTKTQEFLSQLFSSKAATDAA